MGRGEPRAAWSCSGQGSRAGQQGRAAGRLSRAEGSTGGSAGAHSYPKRGTGRGVLKGSAALLHTQHITGALAGSVRWPQFS